MKLREEARKIAELVSALPADSRYAPVEPRALLVGGSVRDILRGESVTDFDLEVFGVAPDKLEQLLRKNFSQVEAVGVAFGILKVRVDDGATIDVGIPRRESKSGAGHRGFSIASDPGLSYREAASRRDFTVNAIALDPLTEAVHDPYDGLRDLEAKILRVVDEKTFVDDPLRVYRGVQLAARLGFTIEPRSLALMKQMVSRGDLAELSAERIRDEWQKLLTRSTKPSIGLELMRGIGLIERDYPELAALWDTPQEPEWHPEGDVWIHTGMVVDQAARLSAERSLAGREKLTAMLGALCHDLGKALTTREIDGRIRSLGHEAAGVAPARAFCDRLLVGREVTDQVAAITADHLKTTRIYLAMKKGEIDEMGYANQVRQLLRRLGAVPLEVYLTVTEADARGRGLADALTRDYKEGHYFREMVAKHDLLNASKKPLISGGELVEVLGLEPGPKIGELIKQVELARDEGKIGTLDAAIKYVKGLL